MKPETKKTITRVFWCLLILPVVALALLLLAVALFAKIPSFEELENHRSNLATELISSDGRVMSTYHIENRTFASFED